METKEIIINEVGMQVHGYTGSEIVATIVEALCYAWRNEIGDINLLNAGKKVIDALGEAEKDYKIDILFEKLTEDREDDD